MLKVAKFYGEIAAARAECPPGSSQAAFYENVAQLVLDILKDADVSPLGTPPMTTSIGPVAGLGKIQ